MKGKIFLAILLVALSLSGVAHAVPEASSSIAVFTPALSNYKQDFVESIMTMYYNGVGYIEDIEHDISAIKNRAAYTQEQALRDIKQLVDEKKFPGYVLDEGEYKYDGTINAIYPVAACKILTEPKQEAEVKIELYAMNPDKFHEAMRVFDYWGEWTSPQGEEWSIVGYKDYTRKEGIEDSVEESEDGYEDIESYVEHYEVGFLQRRLVRFATNEQVKEVADAIGFIKIAADILSSREQRLITEHEQQLQQVRQQAQAQIQQIQRQAQQTQRPVQQTQWRKFYCRRCGKSLTLGEYGVLPGSGCRPSGAKRAGPHDWVRTD